MEVRSTKNYDMFSGMEGNRYIRRTHVDRLVKSIKENNLLSSNPIIVNDSLEVVDGQHRLEAARKLGSEVYYIVMRDLDLDDVRLLNTTSRNWTLEDYLESHAKKGNHNYVILREYCREYGLPISVGIRVLEWREKKIRSQLSDFKKGKFEVNNLEKAETIGNRFQEVLPFLDNEVKTSRGFMQAFVYINQMEIGKWSRLKEQLRIMGRTIVPVQGLRAYLRQLEDIYNHRMKRHQVRYF